MKVTPAFLLFAVLVMATCYCANAIVKPTNTADLILVSDLTELKKTLKTRPNLLILTAQSEAAAKSVLPVYGETATAMKGRASLAFLDCSLNRRICKFLKSEPEAFEIKHYQKGEFHLDYTRPLTKKSLMNFLNDPNGDAPWEEDPTAANVLHADDRTLPKILARQKRTLVMFYAPWCGHCKHMKPAFAAAATELGDEALLVAVNADTPDGQKSKQLYDVSGFPTIVFFDKGAKVADYNGGRTESDIVKFMRDPYNPDNVKPAAPAETEPAWSEAPSHVVHLTDATFDDFIKENPSVLVMFYAPWCGHCKNFKPEYTAAADQLFLEGKSGKLAAVDCTKETAVGRKFDVKGYPTIKYFENGDVKFDYGHERKADAVVKFMDNPTPPPPPPPPEPQWSDSETAQDVLHLGDDDFAESLKRKKHALVMFYAPWCGHCKSMKPAYERAAESLKDNKRVALAAVDATKSKIASQFDIKGYPTLKVFSYGNFVRDYSGSRDFDGLAKFFEEEL